MTPHIRSPSASASLQPLQDDHPAALAAHVAVRCGVERAALAAAGQHARLRHEAGNGGRQHRVDAPGERQVNLAALQARDGLMHGSQRRRAGHVDGHGRTFQAKREGNPSGSYARRGAEMTPAASAGFNELSIFAVADPGIHAGKAAPQPVGIDSGVFKRLPARFQHHALPRVHHARFDGRNAEESGVEPLDALDKRAAQGCRIPGARTTVGHRIAPRLQQTPVLGQVFRAREAAGHAHDRNVVIRHG